MVRRPGWPARPKKAEDVSRRRESRRKSGVDGTSTHSFFPFVFFSGGAHTSSPLLPDAGRSRQRHRPDRCEGGLKWRASVALLALCPRRDGARGRAGCKSPTRPPSSRCVLAVWLVVETRAVRMGSEACANRRGEEETHTGACCVRCHRGQCQSTHATVGTRPTKSLACVGDRVAATAAKRGSVECGVSSPACPLAHTSLTPRALPTTHTAATTTTTPPPPKHAAPVAPAAVTATPARHPFLTHPGVAALRSSPPNPPDFESLYSLEGVARRLAGLREVVAAAASSPGIVGLHGGFPPATAFPFRRLSATLADGSELVIDDEDEVRSCVEGKRERERVAGKSIPQHTPHPTLPHHHHNP